MQLFTGGKFVKKNGPLNISLDAVHILETEMPANISPFLLIFLPCSLSHRNAHPFSIHPIMFWGCDDRMELAELLIHELKNSRWRQLKKWCFHPHIWMEDPSAVPNDRKWTPLLQFQKEVILSDYFVNARHKLFCSLLHMGDKLCKWLFGSLFACNAIFWILFHLTLPKAWPWYDPKRSPGKFVDQKHL